MTNPYTTFDNSSLVGSVHSSTGAHTAKLISAFEQSSDGDHNDRDKPRYRFDGFRRHGVTIRFTVQAL